MTRYGQFSSLSSSFLIPCLLPNSFNASLLSQTWKKLLTRFLLLSNPNTLAPVLTEYTLLAVFSQPIGSLEVPRFGGSLAWRSEIRGTVGCVVYWIGTSKARLVSEAEDSTSGCSCACKSDTLLELTPNALPTTLFQRLNHNGLVPMSSAIPGQSRLAG